MLTKDLLSYRRRGQRLYPQFLRSDDGSVATTMSIILDCYARGEGLTLGQIHDEIAENLSETPEYVSGMRKLCDDRCQIEEPPAGLQTLRWQVLKRAQDLRRTAVTAAEMGEVLGEELGELPDELRAKLYADLPHRLLVAKTGAMGVGAMIDRFNCGQIQGLLFQALKIRCAIDDSNVAMQRRILQALKFHGLVAEQMTADKDRLEFEVSGPMSIFQQVQSYGVRLASFFPHLTLAKKWSMHATVMIKKKGPYDLKLDQKSGIGASFLRGVSHIPEECRTLIDRWNAQSSDWEMGLSEGWVTVDGGARFVPDFRLATGQKLPIYLEIFHRWHGAEALSRLKLLMTDSNLRLIVGMSKEVARTPEVKALLDNAEELRGRTFIFRDFPTCADVRKSMAGWGLSSV